jgi:hypothetical protein
VSKDFSITLHFSKLGLLTAKTTRPLQKANPFGEFPCKMEVIFNILELTNTKATFFCLGWMAETYPPVHKWLNNTGNVNLL